jgi:uncharacterized protein (DUF433 family)
MNALDEVNKLWSRLTRADKAQLPQWAALDVGGAFLGVESTPGVCGGDPTIVRTRIPVWVLEEGRRQGMSDADLLAAYPTLRAEDLVNAWAYVRAHRDQIGQQIAENEAA